MRLANIGHAGAIYEWDGAVDGDEDAPLDAVRVGCKWLALDAGQLEVYQQQYDRGDKIWVDQHDVPEDWDYEQFPHLLPDGLCGTCGGWNRDGDCSYPCPRSYGSDRLGFSLSLDDVHYSQPSIPDEFLRRE